MLAVVSPDTGSNQDLIDSLLGPGFSGWFPESGLTRSAYARRQRNVRLLPEQETGSNSSTTAQSKEVVSSLLCAHSELCRRHTHLIYDGDLTKDKTFPQVH